MSVEEFDESSADVPSEPTDTNSTSASNEPADLAPEAAADTTSKWGLNRRKFLTAAAHGTAAAALLNKGADGLLHIGPLTALAKDLSGNPCTAQDVTVAPQAFVINEPCTCSGTFNATVQFTVTNNTGTSRYCVTLHIPTGFGVPPQDVVLGDIASNTTQTMTGIVTGFPCNPSGGQVCIGSPGSDGRKKCAANTCLTVAWNTSPGAACPDTTPPGGQCRHQRVCITGYGASLTCVGNDCTTPGSCDAPCGGSLHLLATVGGGVPPYTYTLTGSDGTSQTFPASGTTTDTSHCFTVTPTQTSTTYTFTVTDSQPCSRTASTTVTSTVIAKPTLSAGTPDCSGAVTYTVGNCDSSLTYTYKEVNCSTGAVISTLGGGLGVCMLTHTFPQDDADHCVVVTASNGNAACEVTSDKVTSHINAPVTLSLDNFVQTDCSGAGTFTAHASGGTGSYTFTFSVDGGQQQSGSSNTFAYGPVLDGTCHTVSVSVVDSANCPSTPASASRSISQCVTTTAC